MSDQPQDLGFPLPPPARTSRLRVGLVVGAVVAGAFGLGYARYRSAHGNVPVVAESRALRVEVVRPAAIAGGHGLDLPGTVRALEETKLYPRVSGYVRRWLVDIGDHVKAGQLVAEIETPELDAQLTQARAQLAQARATVTQTSSQRDYSRSNSARFSTLSDQQLVSKAQVEQSQAQAQTDEANVAAAQANVAAQEANVRRLADLAGFAKVTAPFAGTITTRTVERGALVSDGNATPMFTLVAIDPVRIMVDVPQTVAAAVKPGTAVAVTVREYPGKTFAGTVARSAGALDPELHTMATEVRVPNPDAALLPGMYVQARLSLLVPRHVLEIPATALYNDAQGLRVAVIDAQGKVKYVPITIERDTGATLHVATGLTGDERIIKIAVPALAEGSVVEVAAPSPGSSGSGSAR